MTYFGKKLALMWKGVFKSSLWTHFWLLWGLNLNIFFSTAEWRELMTLKPIFEGEQPVMTKCSLDIKIV